MGGSVIKIEGLEKTLARFDIKKFEPQIQTCFNNFGIRVELAAKQAVPVDEGKLKGSIFQQPGRLSNTFGASADYASFQEFGTRKFAASYVATLPADWQTFARQFKGGSIGSFEQFVISLVGWCNRHGISEKAAYPIAIKILRNGLKPQPFLYPAFNKAKDLLIKDLQAIKI
jgi:HK97 gp10 family phage protein